MSETKEEASSRRFMLKLVLIIDAILVIMGFIAYFTDSFKWAIVPIGGAPWFTIITIGLIFQELKTAHRSRFLRLSH